MRRFALAFLAASALASAASAQDTTFRGFRIEGNAGYDWFKAQNSNRNGKFGFGGAAGFDGQIGNIVIGPEFNYWQPNHRDNTVAFLNAQDALALRQSRYQLGSAVRIGYLISPDFLVFGKGGYVNETERRTIFLPTGDVLRNQFRTDGYQYGGGVEYTLHDKFAFAPTGLYVSAQYVRDEFGGHSSDQHAMGGVGLRFR